MHHLPQPPFQGFRSPNTTPIPDEVFDALLADLSGAELKVLLYICRRTFGFKKESDAISLHQIAEGIFTRAGKMIDRGTGLSKRHVQRALKRLEEQQIVEVRRVMSPDGVNEINTYSLHFREGVETKSPYGRDKRYPRVGTPVSTTTNNIQETEEKTVTVNGNEKNEENKKAGTGDERIFANLPDLDQPPERTAYVAQELVHVLGDKHSARFYTLIARKVPESAIRQALSEIKADGAHSPPKLFVFKIKQYALQCQK
jgi:phage replication O-like protein O